jgi:hypothetical protein
MESTVAVLLLITSSVILSCVAIEYAVTITQDTAGNLKGTIEGKMNATLTDLYANFDDTNFTSTAPQAPNEP